MVHIDLQYRSGRAKEYVLDSMIVHPAGPPRVSPPLRLELACFRHYYPPSPPAGQTRMLVVRADDMVVRRLAAFRVSMI